MTRAVMVLAFDGADAERLLAAPGVASGQAAARVTVAAEGERPVTAQASEFWAAELGGPVRHVGAGS